MVKACFDQEYRDYVQGLKNIYGDGFAGQRIAGVLAGIDPKDKRWLVKNSLMWRGMRNMKHKLLVLSPHPDDETLGAGGTLLKYKAAGHGIFCLNFTDMKPEYGFSAQEVARRQGEIAEAGRLLGWDGFITCSTARPAWMKSRGGG